MYLRSNQQRTSNNSPGLTQNQAAPTANPTKVTPNSALTTNLTKVTPTPTKVTPKLVPIKNPPKATTKSPRAPTLKMAAIITDLKNSNNPNDKEKLPIADIGKPLQSDEEVTLKTIHDSIKSSNIELRADFNKLRVDIQVELKTTTDAYDIKLEDVKQSIENEALVRHDKLKEFWQTHKDDMREELDLINKKVTTETTQIDVLTTKYDSHDTRIEELEFQLATSNTKWAQLERQLEELTSLTNTKF
jgi:hypothetical protein